MWCWANKGWNVGSAGSWVAGWASNQWKAILLGKAHGRTSLLHREFRKDFALSPTTSNEMGKRFAQ